MALKIDFGTLPSDLSGIKSKLDNISSVKIPSFAAYTEDVARLKKQAAKYSGKKNVVVIGNGGSDNNFIILYEALARFKTEKQVYVINGMDPDYINHVKSRCSKKDTIVIPVTKSGTNIDCLEALFAFEGYEWLPLTSDDRGVLKEIAQKKGLDIVVHPDVGGRFSGLTSCALFPALLVGVDSEEVVKGAKSMYKICAPSVKASDNPALRLSAALFLLEKEGYSEVFMPVYSVRLEGAVPLIRQLMHESVCKKMTGQTFYGYLGPEMQHHTTQRFFGGPKNVVGIFITQKMWDSEITLKVDDSLKPIKLRDSTLGVMDQMPLSKSMHFDFSGVKKHSQTNEIPHAVIEVEKVDEFNIGELMAFWQYVAVYSSFLRDADPFDQPEVEYAKKVSFELRKGFKKQ